MSWHNSASVNLARRYTRRKALLKSIHFESNPRLLSIHLCYHWENAFSLQVRFSGLPNKLDIWRSWSSYFPTLRELLLALSSSYSLPEHAHPGITMIMATSVILMTTKLKSTQRNLMQYSFLRKLVKSIHFLELFVSFVSLCTVRGLHFSEDSFSFNLLRPEVRPFVSVRIFTRGPSGLFGFQISKFKIRSLSDQVNLAFQW